MSKKNGAFVTCPVCSKEVYRPLSSIKSGRRCCSLSCRNKNPVFLATIKNNAKPIDELNRYQHALHHPRWKGGKIKMGGYIGAYAPHHPRAQDNFRYVFEHILVMEKFLNRDLNPNEVVHHINGDKHDNRIENLQLLTKQEHDRHHGRQMDMAYVRRCRAQKRSERCLSMKKS